MTSKNAVYLLSFSYFFVCLFVNKRVVLRGVSPGLHHHKQWVYAAAANLDEVGTALLAANVVLLLWGLEGQQLLGDAQVALQNGLLHACLTSPLHLVLQRGGQRNISTTATQEVICKKALTVSILE